MNEKQLYLIDGHALVYRAYFAFVKNPLINSKGQPTGAIFGFANYILRLLETYDCPYLAVVLDSSKPTFRHEVYSQYKANREEMPDDLKSQMPIIHELIEALNIPVIRQDGLEADDLIAFLTKKALDNEYKVSLVTRDKDLMQLIGPDVRMLAPEGTGTLQVIGPDDVKVKLGVEPQKIVDYLALIGDASDNIPGVPGVGPKTALKIIETAGSVDKLLENPSILENPKLIQKIEENRELLCISKMLATLKTDYDLPIEIGQLQRKPVNRDRCNTLFREMEFSSLLRNPLLGGAPKLSSEVNIVRSMEQLDELIDKIKTESAVSLDTQTTSLLARAAELISVTFALNGKDAYYLPLAHKCGPNLPFNESLDKLKVIIESEEIRKTGQNLKYDYQVFKNYGICMKGVEFDTLVAAYLLDPGKRQYDLDILASQWLKMEITSFNDIMVSNGACSTFADIPVETAAKYSAETACVTFLLRETLEPLISEKKLSGLLTQIEMPLVSVLGDLEHHGMLIDTEHLLELSAEFTANLNRLSNEIFSLAGEPFNLNSPKQIGEILFNKLGIPGSKKTKGGSQSTNVDVLEKLSEAYPIAKKILDYREVQKLLSTYIDAIPQQILGASHRVHSSFNQTVTATGRLSSTNPNLQNIPIRTEAGKRIREAFVASDGFVILSADYSQIELRILAHLSKDPFLIQAFNEDKDIHAQTASAIYGVFPELVTAEMRRLAKTINFGLMYGMGPVNLARQLGITFGEAKSFIDAYFRQFPTIKNYMETTIAQARECGYSETLLGRKRYLPEINAKNRVVREAAERTAINTPVQGTAADIIKIAMVNIHKEMPDVCKDARMLLQVHDELVFEAPQKEIESFKGWVIEKMSGAYSLLVPLKVDAGAGKNWSEAH
jgi:DNA polymerase-1